MTDKEFIKLLQDEIIYCGEKLDDCDGCDDYDRAFYEGAEQELSYVLREVKRRMED